MYVYMCIQIYVCICVKHQQRKDQIFEKKMEEKGKVVGVEMMK